MGFFAFPQTARLVINLPKISPRKKKGFFSGGFGGSPTPRFWGPDPPWVKTAPGTVFSKKRVSPVGYLGLPAGQSHAGMVEPVIQAKYEADGDRSGVAAITVSLPRQNLAKIKLACPRRASTSGNAPVVWLVGMALDGLVLPAGGNPPQPTARTCCLVPRA